MTDIKEAQQAFQDAHRKALGHEAACHRCGNADLGDFSLVQVKAGDEILDFEPAPCDCALLLCGRCTAEYRAYQQPGNRPG